ncbi:MAG TPA: pyrrolysine--tRNA(Pyl) ligase small subunit [Bacillota bacterium]|nr:pyrrolysine--tRNA(Pyl) ligase small subunit [Bacillota bacterium]HOL16957.1 pyrrolysine--tRNA(Pyl) ligase small subunit [Bacillota bacterium]HPZ11833.1 pyrrolysine--tRNA(Pyl) ligase small subunit [Bacillota bacterium]
MIPGKIPEKSAGTAEKKRFYRKRVNFFALINKIKLWPSRRGVLHGIQSIQIRGKTATIVTHCRKSFTVVESRNSRAARWLRNKWFAGACPQCNIPRWKQEKYSATYFRKRWGSQLKALD